MNLLRAAARKAYELAEAVELAKKLPRPVPSRPAIASDTIAKRADRLAGYGKRRGPKGRKKKGTPLNCYPFGRWWKLAVKKAKQTACNAPNKL